MVCTGNLASDGTDADGAVDADSAADTDGAGDTVSAMDADSVDAGAGTGGAGGAGGGPGGGRADLSAALGMDTATRVMGKLFVLAPRLVDALDLGAREYGMSYARGRVVAALRASGPVLMRALSEDVGVTPRTITGLIDALEADGWVERRAHPTDRRATIVALTPAAEVAYTRLDRSYRDLSRDLVSGLPEADQERTLHVIEHISARLDDAMSRATVALEADPPVLPQHPARARRARPGR